MLELLAQGERTVDSLATEIGLSLANASQHLQALRQAALVDSRKGGLFVYYRLADPAVFELCSAIRSVAERRLADLERLVQQHFGDRSAAGAGRACETCSSAPGRADVIILDARPANEYQAGHIAGSHLCSDRRTAGPSSVAADGQGICRVLPRTVLRLRGSRRRVAAEESPTSPTAGRGLPGMARGGIPDRAGGCAGETPSSAEVGAESHAPPTIGVVVGGRCT